MGREEEEEEGREERRERSAPFLSISELAGSFQRVGGRCIG